MADLNALKVKELQDMIVELGMPREDAEAIRTKAPLISSINTLRAKDAEKEVAVEEAAPVVADEPVKKVKTLTDPANPTEERSTNRQWVGKARIMRDKLMAQLEADPVSIIIPLEAGESRGVVEWRLDKNGEKYQVHVSGSIATPQLNGFKFMIPKGAYYPAPRQVAELIANSEQQTMEAGDHIAIGRTDPKTGRPMADII